MSALASTFTKTAKNKGGARAGHKTTRDCPRVTVRFSPDDYERLQELADGMALGVYIRAMALQEELPRRKPRSAASVADKAAIAQLLGLLGQSRIANNLNQLAYHANIGSLTIDDKALGRIDEAYAHVLLIRATLMRALGMRE
ncbi:MobC family plasmid mobilization relaxosome protein [Martelella alba]|uniref:MobC family plasmid mobilization relaxosome protein n=1 Tax=Martelella alba TaxID=2590451 RepID=A0A506UIF2_9HYPH|nr:plasmid mobilization relaxosome protein MobC [Martelella alba]TPW33111.1 MobC family plasmid mobilization relaxosome protein [Martelella alba]